MPTRSNFPDIPSAWTPRLAFLLAVGWTIVVGAFGAWNIYQHDDAVSAVLRLAAGAPAGATVFASAEQMYERSLVGASFVMWIGGLAGLIALGRVATSRRRERDAMQEAFHQNEAHFRQMYEQSPVAYQSLDIEGRLVEVNDAWLGLLGYAREEVVGRPLADFLDARQADRLWELLAAFLETGRLTDAEFVFVRKDGASVVASAEGRVLRNQLGEFLRTLCVLHDVTAHRRAEQALRDSEARYRALFNRIIDAFAVHDVLCDADGSPVDCRFLDVNPAFERLTGLKREEILGRTAREVQSALALTWLERCQWVAVTGEPLHFEDHSPDQQRHFVVTAYQTAPGQFATVLSDVTERQIAEEKIREQAALLEVTQDAIAVCDLHGTILYWNQGAERLFGWMTTEAVGKPALELLYPLAERPDVREAVEQMMTHGAWRGPFSLHARDGRLIHVLSRWTLVRRPDGSPRSILVVASDQTDQVALEAQLMRAQRLESLGVLAGGVAHDLNNVLAPIMMASTGLRDYVVDREAETLLDTIDTCAKRGAGVVRQILTFARGIAGERGALQPRHLIRETESIVRETFPKSIQVDTVVEPKPWSVMADATQMQQLLMNLCVNARDAMPGHGTLTLGCENVRLDAGLPSALPPLQAGLYVAFHVSDTGTGIAPDVVNRMFEPFFSTKPASHGTGLGLSTVLGIAKGHGGGLTVRTQSGSGTTFTVFLPAHPEVQTDPTPEEQTPPPSGRGELVLLAEDEASIRKLVETSLRRRGYQVLATRNGREALEVFEKEHERIAIVLTDFSMPVMDGAALISALRPEHPDVPILLMSGLGETLTAAGARDLGANALLVKPFPMGGLLKAIDALLHGTPAP
jgi:PAS domain S-box-containing protein